MRVPVALLLSLVMAALVPTYLPGGAADATQDLVVRDDEGDVYAVTPVEKAHDALEATPVPLAVGFGFVDLKEARIYGETPAEFYIGFTVADFTKVGAHPNTAVYVVCFRWEETGAWFRLWVQLQFPLGQAAVDPMVGDLEVQRSFAQIKDAAGCDIDTFKGSPDEGEMDFKVLKPVIDLAKNTFDVRIPRLEMERMGAQGEPARPIPKAGHSFTDLMAKATSKTGSAVYHSFDEIPAATDKRFTFRSDAGNSDLRVIVESNFVSTSKGLDTAGGTPVYGVEIGSFQTVPVRIENRLGESLDVAITADVVEADTKGSWETYILPGVHVPAATDDGPGTETLTLVVNTAPTLQHKERARILVSATDPRFPGLLGAGAVDVMGVRPPARDAGTLYFHSIGNGCNTGAHWFNTLKEDRTATVTRVRMEEDTCGDGGDRLTTPARPGLDFSPDVPFSRDYLLSTTDPATGRFVFQAVARVPTTDVDVPTGMVADLTVTLYAGTEMIGTTTLYRRSVPATATAFEVAIPIDAPILGATGREVTAEKPLKIRVAAEKLERTYVVGCEDPCGHEEEVPVPDAATVAGSIFFVTTGSDLTLPILSSKRSGEQVNISRSGALMTLRLSDDDAERSRFANPGKAVVFNVTVRNEGVNQDSASIEVRVNRTGWRAQISPASTFALDRTEAARFQVQVTSPEIVREGEVAGVTVVATSRIDAEATASLPLRVVITKGADIPTQSVGPGPPKESNGTPAIGPVPALLLLGLMAVLVRRRRRP